MNEPIDIQNSSRDQTARELNTLLADYAIYNQRLRNYHWNVKGKRFFQLHEEFEKLYAQSSEWSDVIAERVARLHGRPASTLREFLELSRLEEDPSAGRPDSTMMVRRLVDDIDKLNAFAATTVKTAGESGDVATSTLLEDIVKVQEENAWMLSSWLAE